MPWCPKCGTEYRGGFETCSDCGAELTGLRPHPADAEGSMVRGVADAAVLSVLVWVIYGILLLLLVDGVRSAFMHGAQSADFAAAAILVIALVGLPACAGYVLGARGRPPRSLLLVFLGLLVPSCLAYLVSTFAFLFSLIDRSRAGTGAIMSLLFWFAVAVPLLGTAFAALGQRQRLRRTVSREADG